MNDREILTSRRRRPAADAAGVRWRKDCELLEKKYSQYLFVPLDIPRFQFTDVAKFIAWWDAASVPIYKRGTDIAGSAHKGKEPYFKAVDSPLKRQETQWLLNHREDLLSQFPELQALREHYPYKDDVEFSIWSSQKQVGFHRDETTVRDVPNLFRTMIHDENPASTFYIKEHPTDDDLPILDPRKPDAFLAPRVPDTNSFAVHNLRTVHGSTHTPGYRKWLILPANYAMFDPEKYDDLMERSVAKYKEFCWLSTRPLTDFVDQ